MAASSLRVNPNTLTEKLLTLNCSQAAIEAVSQWCIFYRKDARTIVNLWEVEYTKAPPELRLALLYLANDILQNSRKKGREFVDEFIRVIPQALRRLAQGPGAVDRVRRAVVRLVAVWEERRVFGASAVKSFREALRAPAGPTPANGEGEGLYGGNAADEARRRKLEAAEDVAEVLWDVHESAQRRADWEMKSRESLKEVRVWWIPECGSSRTQWVQVPWQTAFLGFAVRPKLL